jgi:hypothetical protein
MGVIFFYSFVQYNDESMEQETRMIFFLFFSFLLFFLFLLYSHHSYGVASESEFDKKRTLRIRLISL